VNDQHDNAADDAEMLRRFTAQHPDTVTCRYDRRPSLIPGQPDLPVLCDPVYAGHGEGQPYATGWFRCPACGGVTKDGWWVTTQRQARGHRAARFGYAIEGADNSVYVSPYKYHGEDTARDAGTADAEACMEIED
jgi:hypothetical protein